MKHVSTFVLCICLTARILPGEQSVATEPVIIEVDGEPILAGELTLLLAENATTQRFQPGTVEHSTVRRAAAAILVRRQLALKSLTTLGGEPLQVMLARHWDAAQKQANGIGQTIEWIAEQKDVSVVAYQHHLQWQFAWREYLKSRLTQSALRTFFDAHRDAYGGREYRVSQIFMQQSDATSLEELAKQLRASHDLPEAFAEAARKQSQAESANTGGEIGWVSRDGDLPGSVMQAIRRAKPNDVVGPIPSTVGLHLLLVHQTKEIAVTFETLTDHSQLRSDLAEALFLDLVQRQKSPKVRFLDETLQ
jgi:hypothetical protein